MAKISKERLEQYRQMASRDLWDIDHKGFNQFFTRAREEGVELISNNFSNLGMFRAPHHKQLDEIDLAIVGVPLDLGVPNPRPGPRLGPEAVRFWAKDRNMVNDHTEIVPFDLCSIVDYGDVEFDTDPYNLDACIDHLIKLYTEFCVHGCNSLTAYSTGNDMIEKSQVGIDIQGKAVHRDPSRSSYPKGTDLSGKRSAYIQPDTSFTLASGSNDAVFGQCSDNDLFQTPHIPADVRFVSLQVENGIAHDLPRSVIGGLASAVDST